MSSLSVHPALIPAPSAPTPTPLRVDLLLAGLRPGMRALDVGCGNGAVTRAMASIAGTGCVVGVDDDASGVRQAEREGGREAAFGVARLDGSALPGGPYDFVWSSYAFARLAMPDAVLGAMVRAARPGGTVAVADVDAAFEVLHPLDDGAAAAHDALADALSGGGVDVRAGRKLFTRLLAAGLTDVRAHVRTVNVVAGAASTAEKARWREALEMASRASEPSEGQPSFDFEPLAEVLEGDDAFSYSTLVVATGRRRR